MEILRINYKKIPKNATLITGFTGFGNIGYRVINHLAETMTLESIGFWGTTSWYYKKRLESIFTVYVEHEKKLILVAPRVPIPVTGSPPALWDQLTQDILQIPASRYIVLGGLREITRSKGDTSWAAYISTPVYEAKFHQKTTFGEKLAMIGPLSYMITNGVASAKPVMGLLMYSNDEDDIEVSQLALQELEKVLNMPLPSNIPLQQFDYSFVPYMTVKRDLYSFDDADVDEAFSDTDDDQEGDDNLGFDFNDLR